MTRWFARVMAVSLAVGAGAACTSPPAGADWTDAWGQSQVNDGPLLGGIASLQVDASGTPFVAYLEMTPVGAGGATRPTRLLVKRWAGTAWELVGGEVTSALASQPADPDAAAMVLDADGRPIVAYREVNIALMSAALRIARWNGNAWVAMGDALVGVNVDAGVTPSLAIAGGAVAIAWQQPGPPPALPGPSHAEVHVRRWNGSGWQTWDGTPASDVASGTPDAGFPVIALTPAGAPILAYVDTVRAAGTPQRLHVRRWAGSAWADLPDPAPAAVVASDLAPGGVVSDDGGAPVVAWTGVDLSGGGPSRIHVQRWDGSRWADLADPAPGAQLWIGGAISGGASGIGLLWSERQSLGYGGVTSVQVLCASRLDGARWARLGGWIASSPSSSDVPLVGSLALPPGGAAVAAYVEDLAHIHVRSVAR